MNFNAIKTSSVILLAETKTPHQYIFGAYKDNGEATGFLELPEDHALFVQILTGQQTIMGRKTLQATPEDFPDAGRICITHHPDQIEKGAIAAVSILKGIKIAKKRAFKYGKKTVYVIGGASIIRQAIEQNLLDEIRLTVAYNHQKPVSNPVYLNFEWKNWEIKKDSGLLTAKDSKPKNINYRYLTLKRN